MAPEALDATDVGSEERRLGLAAAVFALVAVLAAVDLTEDLREGTTVRHAVVEGAIVLAGAGGLALLARRLVALRRSERDAVARAATLTQDLERSRAEGEAWRVEARELSAGLGELIDRQLERWKLSAAEAEVARLLLKGLSHKELAAVRGVGVATVRQQASTVYRKAGLEGRHDLAAFFLEDLLAPRDGTPDGS